MDYLDHLISTNIFGTVAGWLAFIAILWKIEKNKHDQKGEPFPFRKYAAAQVDDWVAGFICIFVILWAGDRALNLNPFASGFNMASPDWSDLYYLCAGFLPDLAIKILTKIGVLKP